MSINECELLFYSVEPPQDSSGDETHMNTMLEECKEEMDDETYQKVIRATWEEHDQQIETLQ